eukprot:GHVL01005564.1.p1 GENE.GHVL01005564.1~~GHVL01005564.1.p1  ORF type:complete len:1261 (-),score=226.18 GHVL01005564.1:3439-7221(-)
MDWTSAVDALKAELIEGSGSSELPVNIRRALDDIESKNRARNHFVETNQHLKNLLEDEANAKLRTEEQLSALKHESAKKIKSLKEEFFKVQVDKQNIEEQLRICEKQSDEDKHEIRTFQMDMTAISAAHAEMQKSLALSDAIRNNMQFDLSEKDDKIESLINESKTRLKLEMERTERSNACQVKMQHQIDTLNKQSSDRALEIERLKSSTLTAAEQYSKLEAVIDTLRLENREAMRNKDDLISLRDAQQSELEEKVKQLNEQLTRLKEASNDLENEADMQKNTNRGIRNSFSEMKLKMEELEVEKECLATRLNKSQMRLDASETEKQTLQERLTKIQSDYQAQIEDLHAQLSRTHNRIKDMSSNAEETHHSAEKDKEKIKQMEVELAELSVCKSDLKNISLQKIKYFDKFQKIRDHFTFSILLNLQRLARTRKVVLRLAFQILLYNKKYRELNVLPLVTPVATEKNNRLVWGLGDVRESGVQTEERDSDSIINRQYSRSRYNNRRTFSEDRIHEHDQMRSNENDVMRSDRNDVIRPGRNDLMRSNYLKPNAKDPKSSNGNDQMRYNQNDHLRYNRDVLIRSDENDQIKYNQNGHIRSDRNDLMRWTENDQIKFEEIDQIKNDKNDQVRSHEVDQMRLPRAALPVEINAESYDPLLASNRTKYKKNNSNNVNSWNPPTSLQPLPGSQTWNHHGACTQNDNTQYSPSDVARLKFNVCEEKQFNPQNKESPDYLKSPTNPDCLKLFHKPNQLYGFEKFNEEFNAFHKSDSPEAPHIAVMNLNDNPQLLQNNDELQQSMAIEKPRESSKIPYKSYCPERSRSQENAIIHSIRNQSNEAQFYNQESEVNMKQVLLNPSQESIPLALSQESQLAEKDESLECRPKNLQLNHQHEQIDVNICGHPHIQNVDCSTNKVVFEGSVEELRVDEIKHEDTISAIYPDPPGSSLCTESYGNPFQMGNAPPDCESVSILQERLRKTNNQLAAAVTRLSNINVQNRVIKTWEKNWYDSIDYFVLQHFFTSEKKSPSTNEADNKRIFVDEDSSNSLQNKENLSSISMLVANLERSRDESSDAVASTSFKDDWEPGPISENMSTSLLSIITEIRHRVALYVYVYWQSLTDKRLDGIVSFLEEARKRHGRLFHAILFAYHRLRLLTGDLSYVSVNRLSATLKDKLSQLGETDENEIMKAAKLTAIPFFLRELRLKHLKNYKKASSVRRRRLGLPDISDTNWSPEKVGEWCTKAVEILEIKMPYTASQVNMMQNLYNR